MFKQTKASLKTATQDFYFVCCSRQSFLRLYLQILWHEPIMDRAPQNKATGASSQIEITTHPRLNAPSLHNVVTQFVVTRHSRRIWAKIASEYKRRSLTPTTGWQSCLMRGCHGSVSGKIATAKHDQMCRCKIFNFSKRTRRIYSQYAVNVIGDIFACNVCTPSTRAEWINRWRWGTGRHDTVARTQALQWICGPVSAAAHRWTSLGYVLCNGVCNLIPLRVVDEHVGHIAEYDNHHWHRSTVCSRSQTTDQHQ